MSTLLELPSRVARRCHEPTGIVHTLHPGDVVCAGAGDRLETLLGSCVAILLTDPRRTVGVMCHIVHSGAATGHAAKPAAHAQTAFQTMNSLLLARGITPTLCEAYVYGGGNMFPDLVTTSDVGNNNAIWALDALAANGMRVLLCDIGGRAYRRLSWTIGRDLPQVAAVPV